MSVSMFLFLLESEIRKIFDQACTDRYNLVS